MAMENEEFQLQIDEVNLGIEELRHEQRQVQKGTVGLESPQQTLDAEKSRLEANR